MTGTYGLRWLRQARPWDVRVSGRAWGGWSGARGSACFVRAYGQDTPRATTGNSQLLDLNFDPPFPNAPAFKAVTLAADAEFAARFRPRVVFFFKQKTAYEI